MISAQIHARFKALSGSDQIATEFAIGALRGWLWTRHPRRILEVGAGIGTLSWVVSKYLTYAAGYANAVAIEDDPWCQTEWHTNVSAWPCRPSLFNKVPVYEFYDLVILDGDQMPDDGWACLAPRATVFVEGNRRPQRARLHQYLRNVGRPFCETPYRPRDRSKGVWLILCEPTWWERLLFFASRIEEWLRDLPVRLRRRPIGKRLAGGCLVLLLSGCGFFTKDAETIAVPLQGARNAYATIRTLYLDGVARIQAKCEKKELTEAECLRLSGVAEQAKALDFEIRRSLDNPKAEVNWEHIAKLLELAGKFVP